LRYPAQDQTKGFEAAMATPFDIRLSRSASRGLRQRHAPLLVELELYFSCLLRKRVRFPDDTSADALPIPCPHPMLEIRFRPVMTRACSMVEVDGAPDLEAFPIRRPAAFRPRWLQLDFRGGYWAGEFGF